VRLRIISDGYESDGIDGIGKVLVCVSLSNIGTKDQLCIKWSIAISQSKVIKMHATTTTAAVMHVDVLMGFLVS
jgi:hypothetical protein